MIHNSLWLMVCAAIVAASGGTAALALAFLMSVAAYAWLYRTGPRP